MSPFAILWPTFAMVALVFVVWVVMVWQRKRHLRQHPPTRDTFASAASSSDYFRPVEMPANNLANLFEMPVLFFALVPLLLITAHANIAQVALAWLFVLARAAHSYIHIGPRQVRPRFFAYLFSVAVLVAMWLGFFVDMVAAAHAYRDALATMPHP